jgi:hypothetical protein
VRLVVSKELKQVEFEQPVLETIFQVIASCSQVKSGVEPIKVCLNE